jgi:hypothetical protein
MSAAHNRASVTLSAGAVGMKCGIRGAFIITVAAGTLSGCNAERPSLTETRPQHRPSEPPTDSGIPAVAARYQRERDTASLNRTLRHHVRPGDSVAQVERLLGTGDRKVHEKMLVAQRLFAERSPAHDPDGVELTDELIAFHAMDNCSVILQFRDGRLINFIPSDVPDGAPPSPMSPATRPK